MLSVCLSKNQRVVFFSIFTGYSMYVWCRKSIIFLSPELTRIDGLRKDDLGLIITSFVGAYVASRFFMGILSDLVDSKILFTTGLLISALCSASLTMTNSVHAYAALWMISGFAQGCGWPACAKMLRSCFEESQFGTLWSWLACSVNVTGTVGPFLMDALLRLFGNWSALYSSLLTGLFCVLASIVLLIVLRIFVCDLEKPSQKDSNVSIATSYVAILKNAYFQWLALFYLVVFSTRTFFENWAQLLLIETREISSSGVTCAVSAFESGGLVGCFVTGYLPDTLARRQKTKDIRRSRLTLAIMYLLTTVICMGLMRLTGNLSMIILHFVLGACLYGCVNIFGINATEAVPAEIAGFSHSVVSLTGTIGALLSGYPAASMAGKYGWSSMLNLHEVICCACLICMMCTRHMSTKVALKCD